MSLIAAYGLTALAGLIAGGGIVFVFVQTKLALLQEQERRQLAQAERIRAAFNAIQVREQSVVTLEADKAAFDARAISYQELAEENDILKQNLFGLSVQIRKSELDVRATMESQEARDARCGALARSYLRDQVRWISSALNANNYANCKQRLLTAIENCREIGFSVSPDEEAAYVADLKAGYERAVRVAFEREEQSRIRAQIREEQAREREISRELKQSEREQEAIKIALEKALAAAHNQYSEEVERLKARLAEAEERSQRALSQAQLTRAGHVYVISNIGSFGDGVFKVGMTRRLEPHDRVYELGDASVPFPFDVHLMISSDDAPTLENALHRELHKLRINKVNPRREFFKTNIETIVQIVRQHHGEVDYQVDAEALQYRQSQEMTEVDQEYIERIYDEIEEDSIDDVRPVEDCPTAPAERDF